MTIKNAISAYHSNPKSAEQVSSISRETRPSVTPVMVRRLSRRGGLLSGAGVAALALALLYGSPAQAADRYWDANGTATGTGGDGAWNTSNTFWSPVSDGISGPYASWNNAAIDNAIFSSTATTTTVTLSGPITVHNLTFNVSGFTLNGGTITLAGTSPTIAGGVTINSVLAGTAGFTKTGNTSLILNGVNTFTGDINLTGGNLYAATDAALGAVANKVFITGITPVRLSIGGATMTNRTVTISAGSSVWLEGAGVGSALLQGGGNVSVTGDGVTLSNNANSYTGQTTFSNCSPACTTRFTSIADLGVASSLGAPTTVTNGTIILNQGAQASPNLIYIGDGDSSNRAWDINGTGAFIRNQGTGTLFLTGNVDTSVGGTFSAETADIQLSGILSGAAYNFSALAGRSVTLGAANTFTGTATITGLVKASVLADGGTVSSLGAGTTIALNAGTLSYTGVGASSNRSWTVASGVSVISNDGTGALTLSGTAGLTAAGSVLTFGGSFTGVNTYSGNISGLGGIVSNGAGIWVLNGLNTYAGTTTVNSGTLKSGNLLAFGGLASLVVNGGTLDLSGTGLLARSLTGTGGTINLGAQALTVAVSSATDNQIYAGSITGTGQLFKQGAGTLTLTGANSYTGATFIGGGTLALNFAAAGAPASNIISGSSALFLAGGTLQVQGTGGAGSQTFNGLGASVGSNTIQVTNGATLNLGAINVTGGLVNFATSGGGVITTSNADGKLGGWATYNGTDYAKVVANQIMAFTATDYTNQDDASQWLSGQVISDAGGAANTAYFNSVINNVNLEGLIFTTATGSAVTITNGKTLGIDGMIIVAPTATGSRSINGPGLLTSSASGGTIGVLQNSTSLMTIGAKIVDNGGGHTGFVSAGTGTGNAAVRLTGANTYTGVTTLSSGLLQVMSLANAGSASSIGAASVDPANLVLQNGTFAYIGTTDATTDRGFTLVNGGTNRNIDVSTGVSVTFSGKVTSPDDAGFTKTGLGTLVLSNAANDYVGATAVIGSGSTVTAGTLEVTTLANGGVASGIGASSSDSGSLVLGSGGRLRYTGATVSIDRGFTLASGSGGGRIDVAQAGTILTISGTAVGTGAFAKEGAGTLVLCGVNTYSGTTTVMAGTLRACSTQSFGGTATAAGGMTVNSGALLDLTGFDTTVGGLSGAGIVDIDGMTLTIRGGGTFTGAITGTGAVTVLGGQIFNGCGNSYTGATTISASSLSTNCLANGGTNSGIGASSNAPSNLQLLADSILNYTGASQTTDRGFTLVGGFGNIQVNNGGTILTFTGPVVGSGSLVKRGPGTLILSGANTYTGPTYVQAGQLLVGSQTAFVNKGALIMSDVAGAMFDLNGYNVSFSSLKDATPVAGINGGNIALTNGTLTITDGANATYTGAITGNGNLIKTGTGFQILAGCASSYTGTTTIKGGALAVACLSNGGTNSSMGASSAAASNLVIDGGTLRYVGGTNSSTDRQFTLGAATGVVAGNTLDASGVGTGTVAFTSTAPLTFAAVAGTSQLLTLTGTNIGNNTLAALITNNGAGLTSLTKTGAGTWILTNPGSTYTGITTINSGVLGVSKLTNGGVASSIGMASAAAANIVIGSGGTLRYTGAGDTTNRLFTLLSGVTVIESSGTGAIVFTDTGVVTLQGVNAARTIGLGGTNTGNNTLAGLIGNNGTGVTALTKNDSGTWMLTGNSTYTGSTNINGGLLSIGAGGVTGSIVSATVIDKGTLAFNRSDSVTYGGVISDVGGLQQNGSGTAILTGFNTYTGGTTISAGTLQLGNGGSTGMIGGNVTDNATFAVKHSDTVTFGGLISGTGGFSQTGSGTTILTANNSYGGATLVNTGTLRINGNQTAAMGLTTVSSGATLGGNGTIGGNVTVLGGGILAPGNSPGTLTINGSLALAHTSVLNFELGQAGVVGDPLNDLVKVGQNLTLDGTLNVAVSAGGNFTAGVYRLFNYGGALDGPGLSLGTTPAGSVLTVQTSVANQVNLVNSAGLVLRFWDGDVGPKLNGVIDGGNGTWRLAGTSYDWVETDGKVNGAYTNGSFAVFESAPGTVTIDNSAGQVTAAGLQFMVDGYVVKGAPLAMTTTTTEINVGDGTQTSAAYTATIASNMTGPGDLEKTDYGTLVLTGASTFTGDTNVLAGGLQLSGGGTLSDVKGFIDGSTAMGPTTVTVTGASTWTNSGDLTVGYADTGTLNITNGGKVVNADSNVGGNTGGTGQVLVSGVGSSWQNTGRLNLGEFGAGTLRIESGGTVSDADAIVGVSASGDAVITGATTTWVNTGQLTVGLNSTGTLSIEAGASVTSSQGYIGANDDGAGHVGNGTVDVTGAGSSWTTSDINVGYNGTGSLTIENGAKVRAEGGISLGAAAAGAMGTLTVQSAGILETSGIGGGLGTSNITIDGGLLRATDDNADFFSDFGSQVITLGAGGVTIDTDGHDIGIAPRFVVGGGLTKTGAGTLTLTGNNTYSGGTIISAGALQLGDGGNSGSITGNVTDNGALAFDRSDVVTFGGAITGTGTVGQIGSGTTILTANNSYGGGTTISTGTLQLGNGSTAGGIIGDVTDNGALAFKRSDNVVFDGAISGTGSVSQVGNGSTAFTADNTYTGGTTISVGSLVLGNGGITGSIVGNVIDNGSLIFNRSNTMTFGGVVSGTGSVTQSGTGATILTGDNTYGGTTSVNNGSLYIDGNQSAATGPTSVNINATLGGSGTIGGDVDVPDGAMLNPGGPTSTPDTLRIKGNLTLANNSTLNYSFGQANVIGGPLNDLTKVGGNLTLDGTINVVTTPGGTFDPGLYQIMSYDGTLTDHALVVGAVPTPTYFVQTAVAGQVNLINTNGLVLNYWDGDAGPKNDNHVDGGNGIWRLAGGNNNWADIAGVVNADYADASFAIFEGAPGTVSVDSVGGPVTATGMQFASDGYVIQGDALTLIGPQSIIRVGNAQAEGAGFTATIAAELTGNSELVKSDLGTLVLTAANSYTGGTTIKAGTLQLGNGGITGSITGDVVDDGTLTFNRSDNVEFAAVITGTGSVSQIGGGMTTLTADNSYAGGTTISAGTLQLGNGSNTGSITGDVIDNGALAFNRNDTVTFGGIVSGTGSVSQIGSGTTILVGANSYTGTTNLDQGNLYINGNQGAATGTIQVASGATLGGTGVIGGSVNIADGATLNPGGPTSAPDTLTIKGNLTLANASTLNYSFGLANVVGGALNDFTDVRGNLTLGGTINVVTSPTGTFGPGVYRVINYGGALTDNGLKLGTMPADSTVFVQTAVDHQVNLVNTNGLMLNFWDGPIGPKNDSLIQGGSGTWHVGGIDYNWTNYSGVVNASYSNGAMAIFQGIGGTVTVDNGPGAVNASGMQFAADGYVIQGDAITLVGPQSTFWVGDGTTASAGFTATIASVLTGASSIEKTDAGTLILTGVNTYTGGTVITGGTLIGSATSFGAGAITDNAALVIDQPAGASFANAIDGTGSFTKLGAGRLNYTGTGSLTGPTAIVAGTLAVNGSLASSAVTVRNGGTLGGNGTVGATTVLQGGGVAPGNSIGTLTVNGAFNQAAGSIYQVELDPNSSASDLILVKGSATLSNGAGLNVTKTSSGDYHVGTVYTVLTANNGVSGAYDLSGDITSVSSFLSLKDSYDANNVYLTVVQSRTISDITGTRNQVATGGGVVTLPGSDPVSSAILNLPNDDVTRAALDKLSGDGLTSIKSVMMTDGQYVRDAALGRARDMLCASGSSHSLSDGADVAREEAAGCVSPAANRPVIWAQGFGAWGGIGTDGNAAGIGHTDTGFLVGVDVPVWDWRAGFFGGRSVTDYNVSARDTTAQSTDYHLGTYAAHQWGALGLRMGASYTWSGVESSRAVKFGNFNNLLSGTYNADTSQAFAELGYRVMVGSVNLEPFVNAAYVSLRTQGFTEAGGYAALTSTADTMENYVSILGVRPSAKIDLGAFSITARGMMGWQHTFGDVLPTTSYNIANSDPFTIAGVPIARDAGALEAGIDLRLTESAKFGITYGGRFADKTTDQSVRGTFSIHF